MYGISQKNMIKRNKIAGYLVYDFFISRISGQLDIPKNQCIRCILLSTKQLNSILFTGLHNKHYAWQKNLEKVILTIKL